MGGVKLKTLMLQGVLSIVLQLILSIGVPVFQHVVVYRSMGKYMWIMLTLVLGTIFAALMGLAAVFTQQPYLVSAHVMLSSTLAALLGSFATGYYTVISYRCSVSQVIGRGCAVCPCALTSTCTEQQLKEEPCNSCDAVGVDVCAGVRMQALLLPYTGLVCALVILVPGIFSLLLLQRLPKDGRVAPGAIMSYEEQQQVYDGQSGPAESQLPEPQWPEANAGRGGGPDMDLEAQQGYADPGGKKKGLKKKKKKHDGAVGSYMDE